MSPKDMRRLQVWPGDMVRLETRRGAVEVKVRSDRDVPENMVFMPFCYAEAAANLLTNPALDPFGKIPEFKFCAVRAEKVEQRVAAE
jgi:formate dehydrogenase major subunit